MLSERKKKEKTRDEILTGYLVRIIKRTETEHIISEKLKDIFDEVKTFINLKPKKK